MKLKIFFWLLAGVVLLSVAGCVAPRERVASPTVIPSPTAIPATPTSDLPSAVAKLHWFGFSSVLYHGSKNIYFETVNVSGNPPTADLILISHAHSDHANLESLKRIIGPRTTLIISPNCTAFYDQNKAELGVAATGLAEGETVQVGDVVFKAFPAYDTGFHPRTAGGVGYVVTVNGERIYFGGGTNFYPEMARIESDVTLYSMYTKTDVEKVIEILPTKVMILVHTSGPAAQAFAAVFAKLPTRIKFVSLEAEPYTP